MYALDERTVLRRYRRRDVPDEEEAACAVRDLAFTDLALPRLVSLVRVGNVASRRVAEKIGMALADNVTRRGVRYWMQEITNEARRR